MVKPFLTPFIWGLKLLRDLKTSKISHVNVQCHFSGGNKRTGLCSSESEMDGCLTDSKIQP